MSFWLLKSEPYKYSWETLVDEGQTFWDGVRNYQARNNLMAMKEGDYAFFYHSNEGLCIIGIVIVIKEYYPDPGTDDPRWVCVDIRPVRPLVQAVLLKDMKNNPLLADMALIRQQRLSVSPVRPKEWAEILNMGKTPFEP